jgi:hypothetical protein
VLVAPPLELLQLFVADSDGQPGATAPQLHDVLKARAMAHPVPVQYVLPATYDESRLRKQNTATGRPRQQQDEATRAWNLHTALYYKAGGYPWALVREASDLQTCFIGISFYSEREESLATSLAQVFNERGEGVIVRGGPAKLSKTDKQPYLPREDAERLLRDALRQYRSEHRHLPARVVVHKTSRFTDGEITGFEAAADADPVDVLELVTVGPSSTRFFTPRHGPPFRGTHVVLDDRSQALYTTGSIPFYETYPGPYVPQPLGIGLDSPRWPPSATPASCSRSPSSLEPQSARRLRPDHHARGAQHRQHPSPRRARRPDRQPIRLLHVVLVRAPGRLRAGRASRRDAEGSTRIARSRLGGCRSRFPPIFSPTSGTELDETRGKSDEDAASRSWLGAAARVAMQKLRATSCLQTSYFRGLFSRRFLPNPVAVRRAARAGRSAPSHWPWATLVPPGEVRGRPALSTGPAPVRRASHGAVAQPCPRSTARRLASSSASSTTAIFEGHQR